MKCYNSRLYDLRNGLFKNTTFLCVPLVIFFICHRFQGILFSRNLDASWIAYLIYCFRGCKALSFSDGEQTLQLPMLWLAIFIVALLLTLRYPFRDIKTIGYQVILRTGSRVFWWLNKCLWNMCCAVVYYMLILVCITLYCTINDIPLNLTVSIDVLSVIFDDILLADGCDSISLGTLINAVILLPAIVICCFSILQMVISLLTRPVYGFLVCVALLAASSCSTSSLLIGGYGMLIRSECFVENGLSVRLGITLCLCITFLSILVGCFLFRNYDILPEYKEL